MTVVIGSIMTTEIYCALVDEYEDSLDGLFLLMCMYTVLTVT